MWTIEDLFVVDFEALEVAISMVDESMEHDSLLLVIENKLRDSKDIVCKRDARWLEYRLYQEHHYTYFY